MSRRLATLALTLSLATTLVPTTAAARAFAVAPDDNLGEALRGKPVEEYLEPVDRRPTLPAATRARLRRVLAARRASNVAAFRTYARRGIYPHNYVSSGEVNVWTDGDGHMCAAATMIYRSGARQLVRRTAKQNNYVRLADVTDGALFDWILTSGLTQAEVVAIQVPMMGTPDMPRVREPSQKDWRIAENARLRARYDQVLVALATERDASLDAAIDALRGRPDLIATLLR